MCAHTQAHATPGRCRRAFLPARVHAPLAGPRRPRDGVGVRVRAEASPPGGPAPRHPLTPASLPQNNAQRLGASQSTHSLTTPVVSVATPSLLSQGLPFSSMPTAYNTGEWLRALGLGALFPGGGRGGGRGLLQPQRGAPTWLQVPDSANRKREDAP